MKKIFSAAVITVSLLCISMMQVGNAQSTVSMKIGVFTQSWNFSELDAQTIASHFDISSSCYVGPPPNSMDPTAKMNQVHSLNPDYKFLMYADCTSTAQLTTVEFNNAVAQGWILKDSSGNLVYSTVYPGEYAVDIGNPAYEQWFANKVKTLLGQYPAFDGIFFDNSMKYTAAELPWGWSATPINPRTGTYWTDAETVTACQGMLNAMANAIAPKILCSNGVWNGPTFWGSNSYRQIIAGVSGLTGIFSEGAWAYNYGSGNSFWYSEANWLQSVNFVAWVQTNFLSGHPERYCVTACYATATAANLPPSTTRAQIMMFGFCSDLLAAGTVGHNDIWFGNLQSYSDLMALAQTLRAIDMGSPLGAYYEVSGTSVYTRDFANGKTLVNPTSTSYPVTLASTYKTLDGQLINSLTVQPHTGVILTSTTPAPKTGTLSIIAASGGTISPAAGTYTFNIGTSTKVSATPASGYTLTGWIFNGAPYETGSPDNPLTVNIFQAAETIQPVFTATAPSNLIFSDSFATGDFSKWTSKFTDNAGTNAAGCTVVSNPVNTAPYAAQFTPSVVGQCGVILKSSALGIPKINVRNYFMFPTLPTAGVILTTLYGPAWQNCPFVEMDPATGGVIFRLYNPGDGTYRASAMQALTAGSWHCLEMQYVPNAATGHIELWLDGVSIVSFTGNTGTQLAGMLVVGYDYAGVARVTMYVDDVAVSNAYIGPIRGTLTIIAASGGTTTPAAGTYTYNLGDVTPGIFATPASGYTLTGWIFNGAPYETGAPRNPLPVSIFQAYETLQPVFAATAP